MKDKQTERTPFGKRLVELRHSKGLNQRQAAEAIGIDYQNYRKYETSSYPKEDVYIKIADFFGVKVDFLMGREDSKNEITATYSEKGNGKRFIIRQPQIEIMVNKDDLGKSSELDNLLLEKFHRISNEDQNDVIRYLYDKEDL